jgi:N-acetylmuramoyl-L-alanine amidase
MMPSVGLDLGHGINTFPPDKGVYRDGKGYAEHDFNSKLAIEIERHLKRNGITVFKVQEPYANDVPLTTRTDFYNRRGVDLVWSIHANAGNSNAKGICAFYWHDHAKSKKAAELFVEELKKEGFGTHGNGLHASMVGSWTNLHIVRETKMTAVLTENGFMTNDDDFQNIFGSNQANYIKRLSVVHAKAICRYFGIAYKGDVQLAGVSTNNEGVEIMNPTNQSIKDSVSIVLNRLEHKENGISDKWRKDFLEGKLTTSDAVGLIYVALERELIQGSMTEEK